MNKILVIGNFGFKNNRKCGQTIKTRTIFESLEKRSDVQAKYIDLSQNNSFSYIIKIFSLAPKFDHIFFLPGQKQLKFVSPILFKVRAFKDIKVHYIVVGGWVTSFLDNKNICKILSSFDSINCELASMVEKLLPVNQNSFVLQNFRLQELISPNEFIPYNKTPLKMVYLSRVTKEKGIFVALQLTKKLIRKGKDVTLDIYGQELLSNQEEVKYFNATLDEIGTRVKYHGSVEPQEIQKQLLNKHIFIFPTYYPGEGFPGCIVDAKFSGLCVLCSNWKYNNEIIINGQDGYIIEKPFVENAFLQIEMLVNQPDKLQSIQTNSLSSAVQYSNKAFNDWYIETIKNEIKIKV